MKNFRLAVSVKFQIIGFGRDRRILDVCKRLITGVYKRLLNVYRRLKMGDVAENQEDEWMREIASMGELRI